MIQLRPSRLSAAFALLLAACTGAVQAAPYVMLRDPGCPCCEDWAAHVREELNFEVTARDEPAIAEVKAQRGVPAREIRRLLAEKPEDVRGLAVAGMPLGSPGMEAGGRAQPYQVIAFGDFGQRVFASYP